MQAERSCVMLEEEVLLLQGQVHRQNADLAELRLKCQSAEHRAAEKASAKRTNPAGETSTEDRAKHISARNMLLAQVNNLFISFFGPGRCLGDLGLFCINVSLVQQYIKLLADSICCAVCQEAPCRVTPHFHAYDTAQALHECHLQERCSPCQICLAREKEKSFGRLHAVCRLSECSPKAVPRLSVVCLAAISKLSKAVDDILQEHMQGTLSLSSAIQTVLQASQAKSHDT